MALKSQGTAPTEVLFVASNPAEIKFDFVEELHRMEEAGRAYPGSFGVIARWSVSLEQFKYHPGNWQACPSRDSSGCPRAPSR